MIASMNRKEDYYDNAQMENFWEVLKISAIGAQIKEHIVPFRSVLNRV